MVMDATQPQQPSPQSVGREFVRQYYTLLNKAPNHLHRFYNNNSSFIHGEAVLVVGQKNIHNRIQQLNFHDCHAKISQVDAQATLGNGVVVQVTGELSNDGQPMRRFTQTFVLAAQSPKKYYVHNDIFRYQDMYSDEENDGEVRSELDEEHEQPTSIVAINEQQTSQQVVNVGVIATEQSQQQQAQPLVAVASNVLPQQQPQQAAAAPQQTIYYSMTSAGGRPVPVLAAAPQGAAIPLAAQFGAGGLPPQQVQGAAVSQLNGVVSTHDDLLTGMQQANATQQPLLVQSGAVSVPQSASTTVLAPTPAPISVAAVNVNATVIPQTAANVISGFQQSAMLPQQPQQLIQQQQQQPQQQQQQQTQVNAPTQQPLLQQTQTPQTGVDIEENSGNNLSNNVTAATTNPAPLPAAPIQEVTRTPPPVVDDFKTINEQQQQEKYEAAKQMQSEPKTYANLFKSTSSSPCGFLNAAMQQQQQLQQQQQAATSSAVAFQSNSAISITTYSQTSAGTGTPSVSAYNNRNSETNSSNRLDNNNIGSQSNSGPLPQRNNPVRINKEYEPRRTSNAQFGDNQQLFLGNIPHHASEDDLRGIFERFGIVVELRILSKPANKLPPNVRNPPNYGFITYEEPESVQNCLANCPIYFPENTADAQKLNVEEKKPRLRTNEMPPRQSMGGNNLNNNLNTQRNIGGSGGGPQSRSIANSAGGGMMRGNNNGSGANLQQRGGNSGGGARIGGGFNRNDGRNSGNGPSNGGGPQVRGGNNNAQSGGGGSGNYGNRR